MESSIVSYDQLLWIPMVVLLAVLVVSLLAADYVNKKTDKLKEMRTSILILTPFLTILIVILVFAFWADPFITSICAVIPFGITVAFSFISIRHKWLEKHEMRTADYKAKFKSGTRDTL